VPAALWAVAACLTLAAELGMRATGGLADPAVAAAVRLAVVALSLCPSMSLLGAKRPQHGVWQLIVATLAVVLAMPAASAVFMRPGSLPDPHPLERCFMPLLVLVGWMNFAGTRRAVAASCVAVGQLLLLRGFLPGVAMDGGRDAALSDGLDAAAAGLVLSGVLLAAAKVRRRLVGTAGGGGPTPPSALPLAVIDPVFLSLRETLGAAWALRIAGRFNTVAVARGWPCRLGFGGLEHGRHAEAVVASADADNPAWHRDALRAFRSLARRFVSDAWLARHGWQAAES
ncbi:MAG: hypothetical protein ACKOK8_06330, partial [Planctomycetia bacterium]